MSSVTKTKAKIVAIKDILDCTPSEKIVENRQCRETRRMGTLPACSKELWGSITDADLPGYVYVW